MFTEKGSSSATLAQMFGAASDDLPSKNAATWDTKKQREEYNMTKSKLQDQKFSSGAFPRDGAGRHVCQIQV